MSYRIIFKSLYFGRDVDISILRHEAEYYAIGPLGMISANNWHRSDQCKAGDSYN